METITEEIVKNQSEKRKSEIVENQQEYIETLEKLLVFISHNVRQPITHIQGLSYLHETTTDSPVLINKKILQIKQSALLLDNRTRELSVQVYKKIIKLKAQQNS